MPTVSCLRSQPLGAPRLPAGVGPLVRAIRRRLLAAGAVIGGVFGWYLPIIARLYRAAELRGTIASDL